MPLASKPKLILASRPGTANELSDSATSAHAAWPSAWTFSVVPSPVIGALAMLLFGLVAVSGLRLILREGLGQREGMIVALSLGIGIGLPTQPGILASLPGWLHALLESGISSGGLAALVLNALWPAPPPENL